MILYGRANPHCYSSHVTCGGHSCKYSTRNGTTPAIKCPIKGTAKIVFRKVSDSGPKKMTFLFINPFCSLFIYFIHESLNMTRL